MNPRCIVIPSHNLEFLTLLSSCTAGFPFGMLQASQTLQSWNPNSEMFPEPSLFPWPPLSCLGLLCTTYLVTLTRNPEPLFPFFKFIFRDRGKKGEKKGKTWISCLLHSHSWGPGLQPRHVTWLGIEPATFWFAGSAQSPEPHYSGPESPFTS